MHPLKAARITQAKCLTDKVKLSHLGNILRQEWDKILFFDHSINPAIQGTQNQINLKDYSNFLYWIKLAPNRRDRPKKELDKITKKHSDQNQKETSRHIKLKFEQLLYDV